MYTNINWELVSQQLTQTMEKHGHNIDQLAEMWKCSSSVVNDLVNGNSVSGELYLKVCSYSAQLPSKYWQIAA